MSQLIYQFGYHEIIGTRQLQEDSSIFVPLEQSGNVTTSLLAIMSDGMGGHGNGNEASQEIIASFADSFVQQSDHSLLNHLMHANKALSVRKQKTQMAEGSGATIVAAYLIENHLRWLSVGDSFIFIFRDGQLLQCNQCHVQSHLLDQAAQRGEITVEQALNDPMRNAIYSAVCGGHIEEVDLQEQGYPLLAGDKVILASDGLMTLSTDHISALLENLQRQNATPQQAAEVLCNETWAKFQQLQQRGEKKSQDNTTVLVIDILAASQQAQPQYSLPQAYTQLPRKHEESSLWHIQHCTMIGNRRIQQDIGDYWSDSEGTLILIADGAGGHKDGEIASRIVRDQCHRLWMYSRSSLCAAKDTQHLLTSCFMAANQQIINDSGQGNSGRSAKCAAILCYIDISGYFYCVHVGDCRLYLKERTGTWSSITRDDSILQALIDTNEVNPEDIAHHPDQNRLTQALGSSQKITIRETNGRWRLSQSFLLCCDGFWNQLPPIYWKDDRLGSTQESNILEELCAVAVDAARGNSDNVTAIITTPIYSKASFFSSLSKKSLTMLSVGIIFTLIASGGIFYLLQNPREQAAVMPTHTDNTNKAKILYSQAQNENDLETKKGYLREASQLGHLLAKFDLAIILLLDRENKKQHEEAEALLLEITESKDKDKDVEAILGEANYRLGIYYKNQNQKETAIRHFATATNKNHALASLEYYKIQEDNKGLYNAYNEFFKQDGVLDLAVKYEIPLAQYHLAVKLNGEEKYLAAFDLLQKAINGRDELSELDKARELLGDYYLNGKDGKDGKIAKNLEEAYTLYKQIDSSTKLKKCVTNALEEDKKSQVWIHRGIDIDLPEVLYSIEYIKEADDKYKKEALGKLKEHEEIDAKLTLAECYIEGLGTDKSNDEAFNLLSSVDIVKRGTIAGVTEKSNHESQDGIARKKKLIEKCITNAIHVDSQYNKEWLERGINNLVPLAFVKSVTDTENLKSDDKIKYLLKAIKIIGDAKNGLQQEAYALLVDEYIEKGNYEDAASYCIQINEGKIKNEKINNLLEKVDNINILENIINKLENKIDSKLTNSFNEKIKKLKSAEAENKAKQNDEAEKNTALARLLDAESKSERKKDLKKFFNTFEEKDKQNVLAIEKNRQACYEIGNDFCNSGAVALSNSIQKTAKNDLNEAKKWFNLSKYNNYKDRIRSIDEVLKYNNLD